MKLICFTIFLNLAMADSFFPVHKISWNPRKPPIVSVIIQFSPIWELRHEFGSWLYEKPKKSNPYGSLGFSQERETETERVKENLENILRVYLVDGPAIPTQWFRPGVWVSNFILIQIKDPRATRIMNVSDRNKWTQIKNESVGGIVYDSRDLGYQHNSYFQIIKGDV